MDSLRVNFYTKSNIFSSSFYAFFSHLKDLNVFFSRKRFQNNLCSTVQCLWSYNLEIQMLEMVKKHQRAVPIWTNNNLITKYLPDVGILP